MYKYEYKVVFRNGKEIVFIANEFTAETTTSNGTTTMKFAKFNEIDESGEYPVYFSLDDVILISARLLTK